MAIDEQRADFPVTKWDRRQGIDQAWFVGAHADVGGGYLASESFLSDVVLEWMLKSMGSVGVRFSGPLTCTQSDKCLAQAINVLGTSSRQPHVEDAFHASVIERWKASTAYRPAALSFITAENIDRLTVQE